MIGDIPPLLPSRAWLYPEEVADRLQRSKRTLANWRNEGVGPKHIKIGNRVAYPIKDFIEWEKKLLNKK